MSESTHSVPEMVKQLWTQRDRLTSEPVLINALEEVCATAYPTKTRACAKMLAMYLSPHETHAYDVKGLECAHWMEVRGKRILCLGVQYHSNVLEFVQDALHAVPAPVDVYVHYPYTRVRSTELFASYQARQLVNERDAFPHARIHFTDLRLEPYPDETEGDMEARMALWAAYAEYRHDRNVLTFRARFSSAYSSGGAKWIKALFALEGKIMKSYAASELDVATTDRVLKRYHQHVEPHRETLRRLTREFGGDDEQVTTTYLQLMGVLNDMYQHLNVLYTLLRIFRTFAEDPLQNSDPPALCLVALPPAMIHELRERLDDVCSGTCTSMDIESSHVDSRALTSFLREWLAEAR